MTDTRTTPLSEKAELYVNGLKFRDWKSVLVEIAVDEPYARFSFEATEYVAVPSNWTKLQFKPGDECVVYLSGQKVITGYVIERHASFEARAHQVQINGASKTIDGTDTSIKDQTGSYDNKSALQIAQELMKPYGIAVKTVGEVSSKVFENMHISKGENPYRRIMEMGAHRQFVVGTNENGDMVLTGRGDTPVVDGLFEGVNILRANCVIRNETAFSLHVGLSQRHANDSVNGDEAYKQKAEVPGTSNRYRPIIHPGYLSDDLEGMRMLAEFEKMRRDGNEIEAHITVQGWLRKSGELWRHNETYTVKSPMLMLNARLRSRKVTYTQSSAGTFTTLEMVLPEYVGGRLNVGLNGGSSSSSSGSAAP